MLQILLTFLLTEIHGTMLQDCPNSEAIKSVLLCSALYNMDCCLIVNDIGRENDKTDDKPALCHYSVEFISHPCLSVKFNPEGESPLFEERSRKNRDSVTEPILG